MQLAPGTMLGPYEVVSLLGAGGMGEVYRARDTRLGREVAVKVSAQQFSERFDREARAVAALNHPNICTLHDVGPNYLVMELVEGESPRGPLPVELALNYAMQIADALEAAHEKGITHRDLKPGNIKITPEGKVKVLDFGLAKVAPAASSGEGENSPTLSMAATQAGVILGTAGYMAPEQARGKAVDKRADIFAFGVVLYEMLTGDRMFSGDTISDTLAQVLMKDPDLTRVPAKTRKLLTRCLQKEPKQRLRDIGEARFLLEEVPVLPAAPVRAAGSRLQPWIIATVATLAAIALGILAYRHLNEETRVVKLFLPPPEKSIFAASNSIPVLSPDGRRIVFAAAQDGKTSLWVRDLDALTARQLPGTEEPRFPFWSPDSGTVAFFASGKLKKILVAGGPAVTLCDASQGFGGSWNEADVIIFAPSPTTGVFRVAAAGGTPSPVTEVDPSKAELSHRFPWFLPDGRHFLFTARNAVQDKTMVYVGDTASKTRTPVLMARSNTAYTKPAESKQGYVLFVRDRTLMAQPFDATAGNTVGEAVPIAEQIETPSLTNFAESHFSTSQNGILAYTSGASGGNAQLTWYDRMGKPTGTVGAPGGIQWPAISPDGKTVAADRVDPQTGYIDVWFYDLSHDTNSRFTLGPQSNRWPVWSPNGSHVAYWGNRDGYSTFKKAAGGTTPDEKLDQRPLRVRPTDWSKDGKYIFEDRPDDPMTKSDVWVVPTSVGEKPFPYLNSEFNEQTAKLAPDGQWLAYQSDESKRDEIVVETFPKRGGKWQISNGGGTRPVWSRDGKELFFISADQKMMAVQVKGGPNFERGTPKALFDVRMSDGTFFDVGKDGRFLITTLAEQPSVLPMTVVLNWASGLKKN